MASRFDYHHNSLEDRLGSTHLTNIGGYWTTEVDLVSWEEVQRRFRF